MSLRRPKQPEAVREQILAAARQVLAEQGAAALSFDRVLALTDLSKGGLQHHFRTRQALLDGLFEQLLARFALLLETGLAREPAGPARATRTYVKVVCRAALTDSATDGREVAALLVADPRYQQRHTALVEAFCRDDAIAPGLALTCRYAVDGLWHACAFSGRPASEAAATLQAHLLALLGEAGAVAQR